nr:MAG TPA: hypothetical protein [Caudoviricetes sp.]
MNSLMLISRINHLSSLMEKRVQRENILHIL